VPRDFLLKTGLKSEFGSVEPEQGVAKSNWRYAVSSDSKNVVSEAIAMKYRRSWGR
jgi:hypothetical protein